MHTFSLLRAFSAAALIAGAAWYSTGAVAADHDTTQQSPTAGVVADLRSRADRCGVRDTPPDLQELIEKAANAKDSGGLVTIPVYWHVITPAGGGANVSPLIPAQMQVLNDAFAGSKFAFSLQNVQVVANSAWFSSLLGSPEEVAMKAALRQGGPEALNIYTTNGDAYLGWATPAFFYKFGPSYDGVVLWWAAMPGTGLAGPHPDEPDGVLTYDEGDTATHEVGHWLGLDHTFAAGGCTHPGDKIKDTPVEAEPQFFCSARDSCQGSPFPGDDPITNFMDYVDDVCMDNFTADQTKRMRTHWHSFRNKKQRN